VKITGNGPGEFAGTPVAGSMPIRAAALFKGNLGGGPITWIGVPLYEPHTAASAAAIGLGVGGQRSVKLGTSFYLEIIHASWSAGARTLTGVPYTVVYHFPTGMLASRITRYRYANGTATYTGTDSRTPGGLGQLTLVSPTKVIFGDAGSALSEVILGTLMPTAIGMEEAARPALLGDADQAAFRGLVARSGLRVAEPHPALRRGADHGRRAQRKPSSKE